MNANSASKTNLLFWSFSAKIFSAIELFLFYYLQWLFKWKVTIHLCSCQQVRFFSKNIIFYEFIIEFEKFGFLFVENIFNKTGDHTHTHVFWSKSHAYFLITLFNSTSTQCILKTIKVSVLQIMTSTVSFLLNCNIPPLNKNRYTCVI